MQDVQEFRSQAGSEALRVGEENGVVTLGIVGGEKQHDITIDPSETVRLALTMSEHAARLAPDEWAKQVLPSTEAQPAS